MSDIRKIYTSKVVSIPSGSSLTTTPIDMRRVSFANVQIGADWTAANIGFKISSASDSTPVALYNDNGTIMEIIGASVNKAFFVPPEAYATHWLWLWSQSASGTNVDQSGSVGASFTVHIKS